MTAAPSQEALALAREIAVALKPTNKGPLGLARREAIIRARLTPTFAEVDATAKMLRVIETALLQRTKERDAAIAALREAGDVFDTIGEMDPNVYRWWKLDLPMTEIEIRAAGEAVGRLRAVLAAADAREKGGANGK